MSNIFEQLANGEISVDNALDCNKQAMNEICACEQKLLAVLNDDGKAVLKKLVDAQHEIDCLSVRSSFSYGYKLGVVLTAGAFTGL